jgi:hypothetical protein
MKPLIRWTIGNVNENGFTCLKKSILSLKKLLGNKVDYVVVYNSITDAKLKDMPAMTINQSDYKTSLPIEPCSFAWKFYPPRLRLESHEIFLDNDIIFHRIPTIMEEFLNGNFNLLYEGRYRLLGSFDNMIPKNIKVNSGIFGLVPFYNLSTEINQLFLDIKKTQWIEKVDTPLDQPNMFDDQGLIAFLLMKTQYKILPLTEVPIIESWEELPRGNNIKGYHFVQLNRVNDHKGFKDYLSQLI